MNGKRILHGVLGSLAGGVVMGMAMQMMGMIGLIGMMVGSESIAVAWIVHLLISAIFGVAYPFLFGNVQRQWLGGLGYGFLWFLLGPLTLMPLFMGMGLQWSMAAIAGNMFSLVGHLMYGVILGLVFDRLEKSQWNAPASGRGQMAR